MFYTEFTVPAWAYLIPSLVMVGLLYAVGARWLDSHLITFFPEVGQDAITGKEIEQLGEEAEELRKAA